MRSLLTETRDVRLAIDRLYKRYAKRQVARNNRRLRTEESVSFFDDGSQIGPHYECTGQGPVFQRTAPGSCAVHPACVLDGGGSADAVGDALASWWLAIDLRFSLALATCRRLTARYGQRSLPPSGLSRPGESDSGKYEFLLAVVVFAKRWATADRMCPSFCILCVVNVLCSTC